MKTTWNYSPETEAGRIMHCAYQIATGFYRVNNFPVLPTGHTLSSSSTVSFPDIPFTKIPRFWEIAKKSKWSLDFLDPTDRKDKLYAQNILQIIKSDSIKKPGFEHVRNTWAKAESEIIKAIYKLIPSKNNAFKSITIHPTTIGTSCSFTWPKKFPADIKIYLREGQDIYALTEAILTIVTRNEVYDKLDGLWQESELLVDWLLTESSLANVLKKYQPKTSFVPTLKLTRQKQNGKILTESEKFYRKLGVPTSDKVFEVINNQIKINGKTAINLTSREQKILKSLIRNSNEVTSTDEIADIMFTNDNDYSLFAISKAVERLRNKLELNGVSGSYIQTVRKEGYLLKQHTTLH